MPPYQLRVVDELRELHEKLLKLRTFIDSPAFMKLDNIDRDLLRVQEGSMSAYHGTLVIRVSRFSQT